MALELRAAAGFQTDSSSEYFRDMEGEDTTGDTCSIETESGSVPAPYHAENDRVLKITPSKLQAHFDGKTRTMLGNLWASCYVQFRDVWPTFMDHNFMEIRQGSNLELALRIEKSGTETHLRRVNANGAVTDMNISHIDVITDDTWHLVEVGFNHTNSSHLVVWVDGVLVNSSSGVDLFNSTGVLQVVLRAADPEPEVSPDAFTRPYFSGYGFWQGADTGNPGSDPPGHFIVVGSTQTKASATPDCDENGNTPGDDLDGATTWDDAGDWDIATYAAYTDSAIRAGGNALDHGGGGAPQSTWVRHGGYWAWAWQSITGKSGSASLKPLYGTYDGTNYDVEGRGAVGLSAALGIPSNYLVFGTTGLPALDGVSKMVLGFDHDTTTAFDGRLFGCITMQVFEYPLPAPPISFVPYPRPRGLRGGMLAINGGLH